MLGTLTLNVSAEDPPRPVEQLEKQVADLQAKLAELMRQQEPDGDKKALTIADAEK